MVRFLASGFERFLFFLPFFITLLGCLALVTLLGSSCAPEAGPRISASEDSLEISVTEIDGGILIKNQSGVACTIFVSSDEGEQEFELAAGESVAVTGITPPIRVSAVAAGG